MFIICYERFAVSVIGWKPWPFLGNRKNVEFAIALFLGRGTERVVNNMIRWCVQDTWFAQLYPLDCILLLTWFGRFDPAHYFFLTCTSRSSCTLTFRSCQDMFLQCEGFESLPLPPTVRAVAVEAARENGTLTSKALITCFDDLWCLDRWRMLKDTKGQPFELPFKSNLQWLLDERDLIFLAHIFWTLGDAILGIENRPRFSLEVLLSLPEVL